MIEILKKLKKRFPNIWLIIENFNGLIIWLLWSKNIKEAALKSISTFNDSEFICSQGTLLDSKPLLDFLQRLSPADSKYFKPFEFSAKIIKHILKCKTYQLFIVRAGKKIVGLYFIRYFLNLECFLGFVVDLEFRGRGLGRKMISSIVVNAKTAGFKLFSTVCIGNVQSLKAHLSAAPFEISKKMSSGELLLRLK